MKDQLGSRPADIDSVSRALYGIFTDKLTSQIEDTKTRSETRSALLDGASRGLELSSVIAGVTTESRAGVGLAVAKIAVDTIKIAIDYKTLFSTGNIDRAMAKTRADHAGKVLSNDLRKLTSEVSAIQSHFTQLRNEARAPLLVERSRLMDRIRDNNYP